MLSRGRSRAGCCPEDQHGAEAGKIRDFAGMVTRRAKPLCCQPGVKVSVRAPAHTEMLTCGAAILTVCSGWLAIATPGTIAPMRPFPHRFNLHCTCPPDLPIFKSCHLRIVPLKIVPLPVLLSCWQPDLFCLAASGEQTRGRASPGMHPDQSLRPVGAPTRGSLCLRWRGSATSSRYRYAGQAAAYTVRDDRPARAIPGPPCQFSLCRHSHSLYRSFTCLCQSLSRGPSLRRTLRRK